MKREEQSTSSVNILTTSRVNKPSAANLLGSIIKKNDKEGKTLIVARNDKSSDLFQRRLFSKNPALNILQWDNDSTGIEVNDSDVVIITYKDLGFEYLKSYSPTFFGDKKKVWKRLVSDTFPNKITEYQISAVKELIAHYRWCLFGSTVDALYQLKQESKILDSLNVHSKNEITFTSVYKRLRFSKFCEFEEEHKKVLLTIDPPSKKSNENNDEISLIDGTELNFELIKSCCEGVVKSKISETACCEFETIIANRQIVNKFKVIPSKIINEMKQNKSRKFIYTTNFPSQSDQIINQLLKHEIKSVLYYGALKGSQRLEVIKEFRTDSEIQVLILSFTVKLPETVHNLSNITSDIIIGDTNWNFRTLNGVIGIVYNTQQKAKVVNVYQLMVDQSIESYMITYMNRKIKESTDKKFNKNNGTSLVSKASKFFDFVSNFLFYVNSAK